VRGDGHEHVVAHAARVGVLPSGAVLVDLVLRARAFEQIRRRQLREQVKGLTPAQRMARAEDLRAFARADVGGFGNGSEFTWQGLATVGYRFANSFSVEGGYRILQTDRAEANGSIDIEMSGSIIGARWRF
jgi:hypothetical protein